MDPKKTGGLAIGRWISFVASASAGILGIFIVARVDPNQALYAVSESAAWMGSYSIAYEMGVDGLSAIPILLVSILFPVLIAFEWERKSGARGMHGLLLLLQTALLGALCAQDLFLLFFFWAMSVLPVYFLIGIWGGEGRETAAFRSIISASVGNALFFSALILVYYSVDPHTFSLRGLSQARLDEKVVVIMGRDFHVSRLAFLLVCGGLVLRTPILPFHCWFTSVCREAPPSVAVALAA
ncbi:MAG: proton-conducting transporter membrane subunit, partial [Bdellovibrionota bacterium]